VCCDGGFDGAQIPQHSSDLSPTKTTHFRRRRPAHADSRSPDQMVLIMVRDSKQAQKNWIELILLPLGGL
jgi:hypothetical protein